MSLPPPNSKYLSEEVLFHMTPHCEWKGASLNVNQVGMVKDDNEDMTIGNKGVPCFVP